MSSRLFPEIIKQLRREIRPEQIQAQREAVLDLLVWTMFADRHITRPEQELVRREAEDLAWEGYRPIEQYMDGSIRRVRDVLGSPTAEAAYLEDISERLGDARTRELALRACTRIAEVDGEVAPAERELLERARRSFGLSQAEH
jgi:uncharacterized tellurite resistance protein B-like protein